MYLSYHGCYPLIFSFIVPDEIEEFLEPECNRRPSQDVDITFHWKVSKQWLSFAIKVTGQCSPTH